eukprot:Em0004g337a
MLWNLLIHDWIKVYIYHDLRDLFNSKFYNRIASFPTIIISALFHDHGCTHYTVSFKKLKVSTAAATTGDRRIGSDDPK